MREAFFEFCCCRWMWGLLCQADLHAGFVLCWLCYTYYFYIKKNNRMVCSQLWVPKESFKITRKLAFELYWELSGYFDIVVYMTSYRHWASLLNTMYPYHAPLCIGHHWALGISTGHQWAAGITKHHWAVGTTRHWEPSQISGQWAPLSTPSWHWGPLGITGHWHLSPLLCPGLLYRAPGISTLAPCTPIGHQAPVDSWLHPAPVKSRHH